MYVKAGLAVALALGLVALVWHRVGAADDSEGTRHFVCAAEEPPHFFSLDEAAFSAHHRKHWGEPVPCTICGGTETGSAEQCPSCQEVYPMPRDPAPCPHCGAEVP